ncbi:hypothetical protein [Frankia gtarii]|uniref:hypothetical protein n=1 Tax=Frankia gtarii TaxID=2950102 RepID=UPI0021BF0F73|nr:hypothetical protein [Frankia gtarii]
MTRRGENAADLEVDRLVREADPVLAGVRASTLSAGAVLARAGTSPHRGRRGTPLVLAGLAVAAAATAAFAVATADSTPVSRVGQVVCAAGLDDETTTGANADGHSPAALCAELWKAGQVAAGRTTVPPLQACVVHGGAWVYPAADACARLGLPTAEPYTELDRQMIAVRRDLLNLEGADGCHPPGEVAAAVRIVLRRHALAWPVVSAAGVTAATCVVPQVPRDQNVVLISTPGTGPAPAPDPGGMLTDRPAAAR